MWTARVSWYFTVRGFVDAILSHVGVRDWQGSDTKYRDVQITFCGIIKGEHDYI